MDAIKLDHGYGDDFYSDLDVVSELAKEILSDVDFDTIVGRGFSGSIVIPHIAWVLEKNYVLVRKEGVNAHTSQHIGNLGSKWLFVDDFISSGATKKATQAAIESIVTQLTTYTRFKTTYVGSWEYDRSNKSWSETRGLSLGSEIINRNYDPHPIYGPPVPVCMRYDKFSKSRGDYDRFGNWTYNETSNAKLDYSS